MLRNSSRGNEAVMRVLMCPNLMQLLGCLLQALKFCHPLPTFYGMASVIASGLTGVQQVLANAARDAETVQRSFATGEDPTGAIVNLKRDEQQVKASAKIIKVGDELNGAVLDILA